MSVSVITISHLETGVESAPETSFISNISQTLRNAQHDIGAFIRCSLRFGVSKLTPYGPVHVCLSVCRVFHHIVTTVTLDSVVTTVTLDTIVAFVIFLVALLTPSSVM
jgi:hypothetical protein